MKLSPREIADFFVVGERYSVYSHRSQRHTENRTITSVEHFERGSNISYLKDNGETSSLYISDNVHDMSLTDVVFMSTMKLMLKSHSGSMWTYQIIPRHP